MLPSDPRQRFLPAVCSSTPPHTPPSHNTHTPCPVSSRRWGRGLREAQEEGESSQGSDMCKAEEARKQNLILPLDGDARPRKPGAICCAQTPSPWPVGGTRGQDQGPGWWLGEGRGAEHAGGCSGQWFLEQGGYLEGWAKEQADGEWNLWRGSQGAWPLRPETCGSEILLPPWPRAQPGQQEGQVRGAVMVPCQIILAPSTVWRNRCPRKSPSHFVPWRPLSDQ